MNPGGGGASARPWRCAYLTMDSTDGWSIDADLAIAPMARLGWRVDWVPWRTTGVHWDDYDAVYVGVPWDYPSDPQRFMALLETIDAARPVLVNDLALIRKNLAKTYLRDLEARGAAIVPSLWFTAQSWRPDAFQRQVLTRARAHFACERLIVKPTVSTNGNDTFLLESSPGHELIRRLCTTFANRAFLAQPFLRQICTEGEYSLFHFDQQYSHAIQKIPDRGDFRVQEERGARILSVRPEDSLLTTAEAVLALVEPAPVYARSDFVRTANGRFLLMELELIEPSLYLRMDAAAPLRFARAFDAYVRRVVRTNRDRD